MNKKEISILRRGLKRLSETSTDLARPVLEMTRDAIKPDCPSEYDAFGDLLDVAIEMMHVPEGHRPDVHAKKIVSERAKQLRSSLRRACLEQDLVKHLDALLPAVTPESQACTAFSLLLLVVKGGGTDCKEAVNLTAMAALSLLAAAEAQRDLQTSQAATKSADASHKRDRNDMQLARDWYAAHKPMSKDKAAQKMIDDKIIAKSFRTVRSYLNGQ